MARSFAFKGQWTASSTNEVNMTTANPQAGIYDTTVPAPMIYTDTLFEARPFKDASGKEKGDPKFSALQIFRADHPDLQPMKAKAVAAAKAMWPNADLKEIRFPFKSGSADNKKRVEGGKKARDYMEGCVFITGRSKFQPRLSAFLAGKITDLETPLQQTANKGLFFGGAETLAEYNFVASEVDGKRSVTAYLNMVLTTGKGKRLTGGRSAAEAFKGYVGHTTDEDPTAGVEDDEISF